MQSLHRSRWPAAAAIAAAFGLVLGLLAAAGALLESAQAADGSTAFDRSITSWMVDHRTGALTTLAKALSLLGNQAVLIPVVLIVVGALIARRRGALALMLGVVWGGAILLSTFAKQIVDRPRPPAELWLQHAAGKSFPSGHAVQSLSTFVALGLVAVAVTGRARWPVVGAAAVLAVGVAWSRVYLGVHWTTDVIAGLLAAAAWTGLVHARAT